MSRSTTCSDHSPIHRCDRRNAGLFATLIALGEFAVGSGLLVDLLTGIAAFGGVFLNANFILAGVLGTNPLLVILGSLLMLAWRNAGWIGLDRWFMPWIHRNVFAQRSGSQERQTA
jgi:thiosulfate dehydrogenase [quinone] large subunit